MKMKILLLVWIMGVTGLISPITGLACPIPVFRYALEFWDADPYELIIFYEDALDPAGKELVDFLYAASRGGEMKANIEVRNINTRDNMDDIARMHLNSSSPNVYPWLLVRFPRISGINKTIWSGPLNRQNIDFLMSSPARETIAGKLAGNATAVWVMVESGNRQKDRAAMDILKNHLNRLEQTLILPDVELWWNDPEPDGNKPVIKFETISISRNDSREAHLVSMLMNSEDDLKKFGSEPVIFPVYGRGIALWAIVGSGINEWNISEAAEFLIGPCSCQVKLLNPGTDILMMMDWDKNVRKITDINISSPLSGISEFGSRESETKTRLEKATIERLGTANTSRKNDDNQARVIYLDVFGQGISNNGQGLQLNSRLHPLSDADGDTADDTAATGDDAEGTANDTRVKRETADATGDVKESKEDDTGVTADNTAIKKVIHGNEALTSGAFSMDGKESGSLSTAGRFYTLIYVLAGFIAIILLSGFLLYNKK